MDAFVAFNAVMDAFTAFTGQKPARGGAVMDAFIALNAARTGVR